MSYRIAKSLGKLRDQLDAAYPNRSKSSDGWIGDAAHAATKSEHNPDPGTGIVRALDVTDDPAHGLSAEWLAEVLRASHDPRILYIISNRRIASSYAAGGVAPWVWRPYNGLNAHKSHVHVSVVEGKAADSVKAWTITADGKPSKPAPKPSSKPVKAVTGPAFPLPRGWYFGPKSGPLQSVSGYFQRLSAGRIGNRYLRAWQLRMAARGWNITADGLYGDQTAEVARAFQSEKGLTRDGLIGRETWAAAWAEAVTR
jgi:peptidoglycan hydrolase-like protein with peptidoglycan-binding domain